MNPGETLELLARGGAVGAFLGLALLSGRGGRTPARLTGALFCLGAAAHTLTQLPSVESALGFMWWPVWTFSAMGAGLFWAFALELFEDGGALDLRHFAPALRGPESADEATETRPSVAERRLVRAAARGAAQPRLGLRLRRGAHP